MRKKAYVSTKHFLEKVQKLKTTIKKTTIIYISSFISPGKRGTNTLFDVFQFVTPFTHVSRYPGAWNRKQKKLCRKKLFWLCGLRFVKKWLKLSVKLLRKKLFWKFGFQWGKIGSLCTLWRHWHMFLDILEHRVSNKQKKFGKNRFDNVVSDLWKKDLNCP